MDFTVCPMDEASARAILSWRYAAPYDVYNLASGDVESSVRYLMDPGNAYYSIADTHGDLVAYCCFGREGQVPGGDYGRPALDIGLGLRPDLTGQGRGLAYVNGVLNFASHTFEPDGYRVTVAAFNRRALRVWQKAGFQIVEKFDRESDQRLFVMLIREA
jgi:ribosomal-protein-alanine N-acetyltransferase